MLRGNLDLTQINYQALINFNNCPKKVPELRMCRYLTVKSDIASQVYRETIGKTIAMDFHPPNK